MFLPSGARHSLAFLASWIPFLRAATLSTCLQWVCNSRFSDRESLHYEVDHDANVDRRKGLHASVPDVDQTLLLVLCLAGFFL